MQVHAPSVLRWNACFDTTKIHVDSLLVHIVRTYVRMYAIHINACIVNTALSCSYWCTSIQHELDTYMQYYISL